MEIKSINSQVAHSAKKDQTSLGLRDLIVGLNDILPFSETPSLMVRSIEDVVSKVLNNTTFISNFKKKYGDIPVLVSEKDAVKIDQWSNSLINKICIWHNNGVVGIYKIIEIFKTANVYHMHGIKITNDNELSVTAYCSRSCFIPMGISQADITWANSSPSIAVTGDKVARQLNRSMTDSSSSSAKSTNVKRPVKNEGNVTNWKKRSRATVSMSNTVPRIDIKGFDRQRLINSLRNEMEKDSCDIRYSTSEKKYYIFIDLGNNMRGYYEISPPKSNQMIKQKIDICLVNHETQIWDSLNVYAECNLIKKNIMRWINLVDSAFSDKQYKMTAMSVDFDCIDDDESSDEDITLEELVERVKHRPMKGHEVSPGKKINQSNVLATIQESGQTIPDGIRLSETLSQLGYECKLNEASGSLEMIYEGSSMPFLRNKKAIDFNEIINRVGNLEIVPSDDAIRSISIKSQKKFEMIFSNIKNAWRTV